MTTCKGKNCTANGDGKHSKECQWDHFEATHGVDVARGPGVKEAFDYAWDAALRSGVEITGSTQKT